MHTYTYTHTLFVKQFQETRCAPTAGLWPAVGMRLVKNIQYALYLPIFSINGEQYEKYLNNKSSVEYMYLQDMHSSYLSVKSKCIITFYFEHVISSKE